jgi:hypothetical protein
VSALAVACCAAGPVLIATIGGVRLAVLLGLGGVIAGLVALVAVGPLIRRR